MSSKRQALLNTIKASVSLAIGKGHVSAVTAGLNAYHAVATAPDAVAVPTVRFARLIGADMPLSNRAAA